MQSSAENDEQLMSLVEEALGLPADKRADFLRAACGDQTDLYTQAAEVLEWEERMGSFLTQPLIESIDLEVTEPPCSVFQSRDVLCDGRFEILREIGQGGMAIVYEAIDRKLNWRIALKCPKPGFGRLLPPEVRGALKVHHPNICRVNDTHTAKTDSGDVDFLTMEFLDGETLAARLARGSKLSPKEALTIARQLCAGLAAAHQAGILHRDLKPSNIILTTNENGEGRAVITDFGLATESRLESPIEGGTPRYMAPEIWEEHKSGKAADVYALGVILYEMITGTESFQPSLRWDGTPTPPPEPPSIANKDLPALWDKAILPCLDRRPERRPEASKILAVFDRKPLWKSPALYLAALILIALAAGFQRPLLRLFEAPQIRLAILPPDTASNQVRLADADLQRVVEQLRQAGKGKIVVFPPSDLTRKGIHTAEQAGTELQATHVVTLELKGQSGVTEVRADILESRHGTHLRDFMGRYSSVTASDIPAALAAVIVNALHLPNTSPGGAVSALAAADYQEGLFLLNRDDQSYEQAIKYFTSAAQEDPHSGLPFAAMAEAELSKFSITTDRKWMDAARQHVQQAEALNPDSVPVLLARGDLEVNASQPEQGLESYRRAEELAPNDAEVLLRMAEAYEGQNLFDAALRFYRRAIIARPDNYKSYQKLGLFYYRRGDNVAMAEQFQKAVDLAPERYDLHIYLGSARGEEGNYGAAEQEFAASLRIRKSGWALCGLGAVKESEHRDDQAVPLLLQSIALDSKSATCYLNLGDAFRRLHRSGAAESAYLAALKLTSAEVRQNPRAGFERAFIGYFAARLGQRSRAIDETEEALQLYPEDSKVLRRAILTYEALGQRDRALDLAAIAPASLLRELDRHPDLADFRLNSRFRQLVEQAGKRGN
jgi:tetratricopeptide (TPR) repeat protein